MTTTQATSPVRFMKFYVTNGTTKAKVHYSVDNRWDKQKCVTLYAQEYSGELGLIFQGGEYHNETDMQTDYFDKGHVDLTESHPLYAAARARAEAIIAERAAKHR